MDHPEGASLQRADRVDFDRRVRVEFRGAQIGSVALTSRSPQVPCADDGGSDGTAQESVQAASFSAGDNPSGGALVLSLPAFVSRRPRHAGRARGDGRRLHDPPLGQEVRPRDPQTGLRWPSFLARVAMACR